MWLYDVFEGNSALASRKPLAVLQEAEQPGGAGVLVNLANRERPSTLLRPGSNITWAELVGFFREYLEDLLPNMQFDVVEVRCDQRENCRWHCRVVHNLGEETYDFEAHEVYDLLRGIEIEDAHVTWSIPIEEFEPRALHLFYLRVPRQLWQTLPRLAPREDLAGIFDCLPGAYLFAMLAHLAMPEAEASWPLSYDHFRSNRFRVSGARAFLSAVLSLFCTEPRRFHVLDTMEALAARAYERRPASGTIMFCDAAHGVGVEWAARLREPIDLDDIKRVRKLLETSSGPAHLVSDSVRVYGLGQPQRDGVVRYFAKFHGDGSWTFSDWSGTALLQSVHGSVTVPSERLDYTAFQEHLGRHWPDMTESAKQAVFTVVRGAVVQQHGTTVVVTSDISEVARLREGCFSIEPRLLTTADTSSLASMDGALMLDADGRCHACAVILDGVAGGSGGDSGRGARFNSAVRYLAAQRDRGNRCIAIIVSEDGTIDLLPRSADH